MKHTKVCTHCKKEKSESEFFFKVKKTGKLQTNCKACYAIKRASYMKQHYEKYGDTYRRRARERKKIIKGHLQRKLVLYLSDKACEECGISDIRVLDFDHIDPSIKSFGIARGITTGYSWAKIIDEIQKCKILCSNCHRIRTATQFNWKKWRFGRLKTGICKENWYYT